MPCSTKGNIIYDFKRVNGGVRSTFTCPITGGDDCQSAFFYDAEAYNGGQVGHTLTLNDVNPGSEISCTAVENGQYVGTRSHFSQVQLVTQEEGSSLKLKLVICLILLGVVYVNYKMCVARRAYKKSQKKDAESQ